MFSVIIFQKRKAKGHHGVNLLNERQPHPLCPDINDENQKDFSGENYLKGALVNSKEFAEE